MWFISSVLRHGVLRFGCPRQLLFGLASAFAVPAKRRRVVQHRPMEDGEVLYVTTLLGALMPLVTAFNDACTAAIQAAGAAASAVASRDRAGAVGFVTVEDVGDSMGGLTLDTGGDDSAGAASSVQLLQQFEASHGPHPHLPLHLHVAVVRALFSYERWAEFKALVVTAEVRAAVIGDGEGEAAAGSTTVPAGGPSAALQDGTTAQLLAHELALLRALFVLQTGEAVADIPMGAGSSRPVTAAAITGALHCVVAGFVCGRHQKGARLLQCPCCASREWCVVCRVPYAVCPVPCAVCLAVGAVSRAEGGGAGSGASSRATRPSRVNPSLDGTKLPGSGAGVGSLRSLATLVLASTRQPLVALCSVRGDVVVDCCRVLWEHTSRMLAWLDSRDPGVARSRTTKTEVKDAALLCLQAIHAAATKVRRKSRPLPLPRAPVSSAGVTRTSSCAEGCAAAAAAAVFACGRRPRWMIRFLRGRLPYAWRPCCATARTWLPQCKWRGPALPRCSNTVTPQCLRLCLARTQRLLTWAPSPWLPPLFGRSWNCSSLWRLVLQLFPPMVQG